MPYSMDEFADQIRSKFPAYQDWPTDHLVTQIIAKHPEYRSWVTLDPRAEIATRPAPAPTQPPDQTGPVRRFLEGAGVPTSMAEMQQMGEAVNPMTQLAHGNLAALAGPVGLAASGIAHKIGGDIGTQTGEAIAAAQADDYGGAMKHALGAAVPLVGPPLAEGNIAGAAGTATSLLAPSAIGKVARMSAAPLTETIGSQIAAKGGEVFTPFEPVTVPKFGTGAAAVQKQIEALAEKYPNATVYDEGNNLRIEANRPEAPSGASTAATAGGAARGGYGIAGALAKHPIATIVGGVIGQKFGHPIMGAEAGYMAAEALQRMIRSPLWKATSGSVRTSVGKAMQSQDFGTVAVVASRVLDGSGLEDDYGHDQALHGLISSIPQQIQSDPIQLRQTLNDYDAVYVNRDGTTVPVPFHVQKQTYDALTSH